jgi:hypothetical protein
MMGAFGGNAGLLSLWFDEETWDWRFEFVNCKLGTQHIWWVVHILDLITLGLGIAYAGFLLAPKLLPTQRDGEKHLGNGDVTRPEKNENGTVHLPKINGNLDSLGAGKKSLHQKRSKATIQGQSSSPVGSTVSNS